MFLLFLNLLLFGQSFMDLQFPNGQLTYVSGEGLTVSTFVPLCGGLLQAQGQYPGDMRFSYSCKVSIEIIKLIMILVDGAYSHFFLKPLCSWNRTNVELESHQWYICLTNHSRWKFLKAWHGVDPDY